MLFCNSLAFYDPTDVGNLVSGSSDFSRSILNIWKFSVHVLLKTGLENFEHYFTSVWDECSCEVGWTFFGIAFFGIGMKTFSSPVATAEFSKFAGILSAALSQHHLLRFKIAELEFHSCCECVLKPGLENFEHYFTSVWDECNCAVV